MIAIGADHGGFKLKEELKAHYKGELKDFGTYDETRGLEEPKVALAVAEAVANGECEAGILICRSGIGMAMTANKVKKIRCALCYNNETALSAKQHNNAFRNIEKGQKNKFSNFGNVQNLEISFFLPT